MRRPRRSRSERAARASFALLVGMAVAAGAAGAPQLKAGVFEPPRAAPDFALIGSDGQPLTMSRFRGKVVVLEFGFTSCPDVCPKTLAALASVRKKLGTLAGDVQVVYVTVDPETDDAERLRTHLAKFDPTFLGGTGSAEQLEAVRKEYGIAAERVKTSGGDTWSHSSFTYLIDRAGQLRALVPYGTPVDDTVHDLKILLEP
jgi:protein SCO1/2